MEVSARSGDCKICFKVVTARQHALECDNCQRWVHRLCGTGITYTQYCGIMDKLAFVLHALYFVIMAELSQWRVVWPKISRYLTLPYLMLPL